MAVADPKSDLIFVISIFIVLFVAWIATGGPDTDRRKGLLPTYLSNNSSSSISSSPRPTLGGRTNSQRNISETDYGTSKYMARLDLTGTAGAKRTNPHQEYVVITSKSRQTVDITGWPLLSLRAYRVFIPPAVRGLHVGGPNVLGPVTLGPNEQAIVTTGRSPLGLSFKVNKCSGYLEQIHDFTPMLRQNCPHPYDQGERSLVIKGLDNNCIDYIGTMKRCIMPVKRLPSSLTRSCQDYIKKTFNYTDCIQTHKYDSDFYNGEWRLFLEQKQELWQDRRETIFLLDAANRLVDSLSY